MERLRYLHENEKHNGWDMFEKVSNDEYTDIRTTHHLPITKESVVAKPSLPTRDGPVVVEGVSKVHIGREIERKGMV